MPPTMVAISTIAVPVTNQGESAIRLWTGLRKWSVKPDWIEVVRFETSLRIQSANRSTASRSGVPRSGWLGNSLAQTWVLDR